MSRCLGYDENGDAFDCPNLPGTPWSPLWCAECNDRRLARLGAQFKQLKTDITRRAEG